MRCWKLISRIRQEWRSALALHWLLAVDQTQVSQMMARQHYFRQIVKIAAAAFLDQHHYHFQWREMKVEKVGSGSKQNNLKRKGLCSRR